MFTAGLLPPSVGLRSQAHSLWPGDRVPAGCPSSTATRDTSARSAGSTDASIVSDKRSLFGARRHSEVAGGIQRRSQHVWRCQTCRLCLFDSATNDAAVPLWDAGPNCCWRALNHRRSAVRRQRPVCWWASQWDTVHREYKSNILQHITSKQN